MPKQWREHWNLLIILFSNIFQAAQFFFHDPCRGLRCTYCCLILLIFIKDTATFWLSLRVLEIIANDGQKLQRNGEKKVHCHIVQWKKIVSGLFLTLGIRVGVNVCVGLGGGEIYVVCWGDIFGDHSKEKFMHLISWCFCAKNNLLPYTEHAWW